MATKQQLIEKMQNRIAEQSTEMLKEVAQKLMNTFTTEATLVFNYVMTELENRMPEAEYVEFCDSL